MKFEQLPEEKQSKMHEEALEINKLVGQWLLEEKTKSATTAANQIIKEQEFKDAYKETFGNGWAEIIARDTLGSSELIEDVQDAPRVLDDMNKTDMFVRFKGGPLVAVQMTVLGFEESRNDKIRKSFEEKAMDVVRQGDISFVNEEKIPLTLIKGNIGEFSAAVAEWESEGRHGRPADYMRKDFPVKAIRQMAEFLKLKGEINKNRENLRVAQEISTLLENFQHK